MKKIAFLSLILVVWLAGCGPGQVNAGMDQNNGQVELAVGQSLVITLDSNPTTGYSWQLGEIDTAVLSQQGGSEYAQQPGTQGLVGAGGTETFRFEAMGPGTVTLQMFYLRPWEQVFAPENTFTLTVVVR